MTPGKPLENKSPEVYSGITEWLQRIVDIVPMPS